MKKGLFIVAVIATVGFVSCKKDYTCTCTAKDSSGATIATTSGTVTAKKKDAKAACENGNSSAGGSTITCVLD